MSDSRTVLPAPKLLNLISVRAGANAITLAARASSRVASCPVCEKQSLRVHSRYTRTLADLPWQGIPVTLHLHVRRFFCDERTCHRARSSRSVCLVSSGTTVAEPSGSTDGSRTSPSPSEGKRALVSCKTSGSSWSLERDPAQPHPFNTASRSRDTKGIECGRLRFPSRNPLRNGTGGSRTS